MIARSNIFLIGNGFDLAHGLKTSYKDFMRHLCYKLKENKNSLPELIRPKNTLEFNNEGILDPKCFRNMYHDKCEGNIIFMKIIEEMHLNNNWCDIEQLYFDMLKSAFINNSNSIKLINEDFEIIKAKLEDYLSNEYKRKQVEKIESYSNLFNSFHLGYRLVINFNYTNLPELYLNKETAIVFNIHGQISNDLNPTIFGYAASSEKIEEFQSQNDDEYLRNIKSINYKRTENEALLDRFLSENTYSQFNVFILGHSCGISDEYILNKILGNEGVVNIIPLYYKDFNHYKEQFNNISRIIKVERARRKVVPFSKCPMMVQKEHNEEIISECKNRIDAFCRDIVFKE